MLIFVSSISPQHPLAWSPPPRSTEPTHTNPNSTLGKREHSSSPKSKHTSQPTIRTTIIFFWINLRNPKRPNYMPKKLNFWLWWLFVCVLFWCISTLKVNACAKRQRLKGLTKLSIKRATSRSVNNSEREKVNIARFKTNQIENKSEM